MNDTSDLAEAVGLARAWAEALAGVGAPLVGPETLSDLTGRLALTACSAIRDRGQARAAGRQIGRSLAEANLTGPVAVENVIEAVGEYWLTGVPDRPSPVDPACVGALQAGIAGGHSEAVRRLLLAQQEGIHRAALQARDLAERVAHAALTQYHILSTAPGLGVGTADLHGRIITVNQTLQEMLGYRQEELQGRVLTDVIHPHDVSTATAQHTALTTGTVPSVTTRRLLRHRDGRLVSATVSLTLVRDRDGRPLHQLAVLTSLPRQRRPRSVDSVGGRGAGGP